MGGQLIKSFSEVLFARKITLSMFEHLEEVSRNCSKQIFQINLDYSEYHVRVSHNS